MVGRGELEKRAHPSPDGVGKGAGVEDGFGPDRMEMVFLDQSQDQSQDKVVRFDATAEHVARARRVTRGVLDSWGLARHQDTADRLLGELITNALKHTGARSFGLRLARRSGWLRVEVRDASRALPCLVTGDPDDAVGGGLAVVDKLSDRWGADLLPRGKGVWFELRLR